MPKVKIINLRPGACVVNTMKLVIPGGGSVVRNDDVIGDPDLIELEAAGIIKIVSAEDVPEAKCTIVPSPTAPKTPPNSHKAKKEAAKPAVKVDPFRAMDKDGPEDQMGRPAVVMGENGPEIKKMGPGINGKNGPKYEGDSRYKGKGTSEPAENGVSDADGFTEV